ncbi:hypothetical protein BGZ83_008122 [Gryganskiella cystojenkinii]|nr:hypothetical protein BGZ83_008122 [Gryganskiella cystojenkinii]
MKVLSSLATMLLCSSAVMAHFTLDYPASRGFNDDAEGNAPCGGFDTVTNRTQFPLTKGFLDINSHHPSATVKINVVLSNNPGAADFTAAAGTPASSLALSHPGHACMQLDLSSFKGAANNVNATIQVVYNGGDSPLYQCTDVVLVTTAAGFDQSKCINDNGEAPSITSSGSTPVPTSAGPASVSAKSLGASALGAAMVAAALMV